jgi:hypothetical protein
MKWSGGLRGDENVREVTNSRNGAAISIRTALTPAVARMIPAKTAMRVSV